MEKGHGDMALEIMESMISEIPDISKPSGFQGETNYELPDISDAQRASLQRHAGIEIIEESATPKVESKVKKDSIKLQTLVTDIEFIQEHLDSLKELVVEMTSVGGIGVNMASAKSKNEPNTKGLARRGTFGTPLNPEDKKKLEEKEKKKKAQLSGAKGEISSLISKIRNRK